MSSTPPFYQKLSLNLITVAILSMGLYYGRGLALPLLFAILLSALLLKLVQILQRKGFPKFFAIFLPVTFAVLLGGIVLYFLTAQIVSFASDLPALREKIGNTGESLQLWVNTNLHIPVTNQNQLILQAIENLRDNVPLIASTTIGSITDVLAYITLLPIYTFLLLYYRSTLKAFLISTFAKGPDESLELQLPLLLAARRPSRIENQRCGLRDAVWTGPLCCDSGSARHIQPLRRIGERKRRGLDGS